MLEFALRILLWECETIIRRRAHKITNDDEECVQNHILRVGIQLILMSFLKVQVRLSKKFSKTMKMILRSLVYVPAFGTIVNTILSQLEREHVEKLKLSTASD